MRSLVLFSPLGATGRLRLGQLRDFCLLFVRQLHRLNELKGLFEAMDETGRIRVAGWRRGVGCRHRRRRASGELVGLGFERGDWNYGFL